jgi:hypothetical protein
MVFPAGLYLKETAFGPRRHRARNRTLLLTWACSALPSDEQNKLHNELILPDAELVRLC